MSQNIQILLCVLVAAAGFLGGIILMWLLARIYRRHDGYADEEYAPAPAAEESFTITRREIADDTRKFGDPEISVTERLSEPHLPMSIKLKGKTYAMLYGTDFGIMMVIRLPGEYAAGLAAAHPAVRRADFPKGPDWYYVPIDGTFGGKEPVYAVLDMARFFAGAKVAGDAGKEAEIKEERVC